MAKDELTTMNSKEILRLQIIEKIDTERLKQSEAGKVLQISCRQVRRLLKSYRRQGAKGLPVALYSDKHSIFRVNTPNMLRAAHTLPKNSGKYLN